MLLSRIELRPEAAGSSAFWARVESVYDVHRVVWQWFTDSPGRKRDFLYRQEGEGTSVRFYTLSDREPKDPDGLWNIESKAFSPRFVSGDRLEFSLRANPTRRSAHGSGKGKRHDVVMDAKRRPREIAEDKEGPGADLIQSECFRWLEAKAMLSGFALQPGDVDVEGYRQPRFQRQPGALPVQVTTVELRGCLTVTEPGRFVEALRQGIGPAKGFGCGLMLVRRA